MHPIRGRCDVAAFFHRVRVDRHLHALLGRLEPEPDRDATDDGVESGGGYGGDRDGQVGCVCEPADDAQPFAYGVPCVPPRAGRVCRLLLVGLDERLSLGRPAPRRFEEFVLFGECETIGLTGDEQELDELPGIGLIKSLSE